MKGVVEVTIGVDGKEVTVAARHACEAFTQAVEEALGTRTSNARTNDYHRAPAAQRATVKAR